MKRKKENDVNAILLQLLFLDSTFLFFFHLSNILKRKTLFIFQFRKKENISKGNLNK